MSTRATPLPTHGRGAITGLWAESAFWFINQAAHQLKLELLMMKLVPADIALIVLIVESAEVSSTISISASQCANSFFTSYGESENTLTRLSTPIASNTRNARSA